MNLKIKMNINDNFHNCPQARLLSLFVLYLHLSARDNLDCMQIWTLNAFQRSMRMNAFQRSGGDRKPIENEEIRWTPRV